MEPAQIAERVRAIIAQQIGKSPEQIHDDDPLTELGIESLDAIEVVFAIEEEFGIDIPLNANAQNGLGIDSVGELVGSVAALVDAKD